MGDMKSTPNEPNDTEEFNDINRAVVKRTMSVYDTNQEVKAAVQHLINVKDVGCPVAGCNGAWWATDKVAKIIEAGEGLSLCEDCSHAFFVIEETW